MPTDTHPAPSANRSAAIRISIVLLVLFCAVAFSAWSTDSITLQGERTIYTAACQQGTWHGSECSGQLVASQRYRFRALKAHSEVLFWAIGARGPSGKYTECIIMDGRNWQCKPSADAAQTITHQMAHGLPVRDAQVHELPFHQVQKWKWQLLSMGLPAGRSAMN
ncbi:MAG TPA: hypothetical protein VFL86_05770 [Burkholderiaceae bacterium]|nr:hypothetical protein [Burkholderiaceae bacterium]